MDTSDSGDQDGRGRARRTAAIAKVRQIDTTAAAPAVPISRRLASLISTAAPILLILSIAARLGVTYLGPNGANFVDLHVYLGGAAALDHPGTLYSFVYAEHTPDFPLPFTYPPFAAIVFYPLHLLPFGLVGFLWQVAMMAALYGSVRISQRLLGVPDGTVTVSRWRGRRSPSGLSRCATTSTMGRSTSF